MSPNNTQTPHVISPSVHLQSVFVKNKTVRWVAVESHWAHRHLYVYKKGTVKLFPCINKSFDLQSHTQKKFSFGSPVNHKMFFFLQVVQGRLLVRVFVSECLQSACFKVQMRHRLILRFFHDNFYRTADRRPVKGDRKTPSQTAHTPPGAGGSRTPRAAALRPARPRLVIAP